MCRRQTLTPLSPAERSVAEQHYRLVEWYVRHRGLPVDEYLDVAVFGYLLAVKRWFARPDLYRYEFTTLDAASKLIAKLKAEIDSLKQEISDYKSVHSKLRAAELERENTELRGKVRSYEDVIQRNNLWRFFHPRKEKAVTRDEAR